MSTHRDNVKYLLDAIAQNTITVNIPTPQGKDDYKSVVVIQHIADELEALGFFKK